MSRILFCRSVSRVGTFIGKQTSINSTCRFSNVEADTFKLQEFTGKYLGNKKVLEIFLIFRCFFVLKGNVH